jgi:type I restriction enzyme S subunit
MSWKHVSLQSVIERPISGEWGDGEGETKILRTTNFTNDGSLDLSSIVLRNIDQRKIDQKQLKYGDSIIEKSGGSPNQPVGRVVFFDQKDDVFLCNNFTSVIRSKPEIDNRYLFWFLFNNHLNNNTLKYQNKTTGIINLQLERYISELQIPLPPITIQKRIAQILDIVDTLKRKDQELLKKYDELAQAIFIDMFGDPVKNEKGWEVKKFNEIGTLDRGVSKHRPRNAPELLGGIYPLIQTGDVSNSGGIINNFKSTYSEIGLKQSKIWSKGTLCITIAANIAKTGILNFDACFPDSIVGFKPDVSVSNSVFIQHWIGFLQKMLEDNAPESAQKNINLEILRNLDVICPPVGLQNSFASIIDNIKEQKKFFAEMESTHLFNSVIEKAFNGELVN